VPGGDELATELAGRATSLDDVVPGNSRCLLDGGVLYDQVGAMYDLDNVGNEKGLLDASHDVFLSWEPSPARDTANHNTKTKR
jgi:hypothetical protein